MSKEINFNTLVVEDVYKDDYPDFADAYIAYAEYEDGTPLTEDELIIFETEHYGLAQELALKEVFG